MALSGAERCGRSAQVPARAQVPVRMRPQAGRRAADGGVRTFGGDGEVRTFGAAGTGADAAGTGADAAGRRRRGDRPGAADFSRPGAHSACPAA